MHHILALIYFCRVALLVNESTALYALVQTGSHQPSPLSCADDHVSNLSQHRIQSLYHG